MLLSVYYFNYSCCRVCETLHNYLCRRITSSRSPVIHFYSLQSLFTYPHSMVVWGGRITNKGRITKILDIDFVSLCHTLQSAQAAGRGPDSRAVHRLATQPKFLWLSLLPDHPCHLLTNGVAGENTNK